MGRLKISRRNGEAVLVGQTVVTYLIDNDRGARLQISPPDGDAFEVGVELLNRCKSVARLSFYADPATRVVRAELIEKPRRERDR